MATHWVVGILAATVLLCPLQNVNSQIPAACANEVSLQSLTCCPNQCGESEGRGQCGDLDLPANYSLNSTDVRQNWPHYFTRGCICTGNYGGYDCSACKYGYYGTTCKQTQVLPRRSIQELTDSEWREYIEILNMTRSYNSGYKVVLGQYTPGTANIDMSDITLYDLFVWQHHFAAKDTGCGEGDNCTRADYAHQASGFPTWHRQYILWFEWEIQQMLHTMGRENYHTFRTHYWDWRREIQITSHGTDEIFLENRLGVTRPNEAGQPQVYGDLYTNGWNTICWYGGSGNVMEPRGTLCDPSVNTGPLLRCPFLPDGDPCNSTNHDWPNITDVNVALNKPEYDTEPFNKTATVDSFRNFMEGNDIEISIPDCRRNRLCACEVGGPNCEGADASTPILRRLHNSVHIIVGTGYFGSGLQGNMTGVMADSVASPNDPLFINHHTMVDCILEEWLQGHPNAEYPPNVPSTLNGHQKDGYIVPFYPLFKNEDMFKTADNFGYSCNLSDTTGTGCGEGCIIGIAIGSSLVALLIVAIVAAILCALCKRHHTSYTTVN